ncbi:hypothetical protein HFTV1-gp36 [Haloferax tailed virus 1]|uniref:Uncharacterized protein n=1 Tax=Haloferax tailed virus 1 TaxID=2507575 RepID=A0A410N6T4_HFTV1|nr:hypothetical protein M1M17_gp36 [Haloferax tailed virus 1]QAS68869.1 hypothetical protein HFTV1-gp36 [Haloferax tailed virus 1]
MTEQEPVQDELAEEAADLILEAEQQYQENLAEQEAFLETVAEEEGAEVLETQCNLIGEYTVPLKAKLNGELMDKLGEIDSRIEHIQSGDGRMYEFGEVADRAAQLLADVIDDESWHKEKFYQAYESEGLAPLGTMISRVIDSLKTEKERRMGAADGFRKKSEGT